MDASDSLVFAIETIKGMPANGVAGVCWSLFVRANSRIGCLYPPEFFADLGSDFAEASGDVLGDLWVGWATGGMPRVMARRWPAGDGEAMREAIVACLVNALLDAVKEVRVEDESGVGVVL